MKKIIAIIFSVLLVFSVFSACGPKINKGDTDNDYEVNLNVD